jgi:hypothetical protein
MATPAEIAYQAAVGRLNAAQYVYRAAMAAPMWLAAPIDPLRARLEDAREAWTAALVRVGMERLRAHAEPVPTYTQPDLFDLLEATP